MTSSVINMNEMSEKQLKEYLNRERILNTAGSNLSLAGQDTDLEMDYYDYNIHNASSVPGSYIGMDPAFCVWIPPFAPKVLDTNIIDSRNVTTVNEEEALEEITELARNRLPKINKDRKTKNLKKPNDKVQGASMPDYPVKAIIRNKDITVAIELANIKYVDEDDAVEDVISPI
jgi:hypothetical protein